MQGDVIDALLVPHQLLPWRSFVARDRALVSCETVGKKLRRHRSLPALLNVFECILHNTCRYWSISAVSLTHFSAPVCSAQAAYKVQFTSTQQSVYTLCMVQQGPIACLPVPYRTSNESGLCMQNLTDPKTGTMYI